jgi:hypothetical protein
LSAEEASLPGTVTLALLYALSGAFYASLYYPGLMDWDSVTIHRAILEGYYHPWFPLPFSFFWKLTNSIGNPGTIWSLQTLLVLSGMFFLSYFLLKIGRPLSAFALLMIAISPPFVYSFHEISKDTFMAAALVALTGISAWVSLDTRVQTAKLAGLIVCLTIVCLTVLAIIPRFNAVFATLPIFSVALYNLANKDWKRGLQYVLVVLFSFMVVLSVFNRVAKMSDPPPLVAGLISFDIAGISRNGGNAPFVLDGGDIAPMLKKCYSPIGVDSFIREGCKGSDKALYDALKVAPLEVTAKWIDAIVHNPLEYVRHRIAYVLFLLRAACHTSASAGDADLQMQICSDYGLSIYDEVLPEIPKGSEPRKHTLVKLYDSAGKVFFWIFEPWFVTAIAVAAWTYSAISLHRMKDDQTQILSFALASSVILYLFSYMLFGVASSLRYTYWMYIGTSICLFLLFSRSQLAKRVRYYIKG